MSRKYNKQCVDCGALTSSLRCKPCASRESAGRRGIKGHPPTGPKHHSEETKKKIATSLRSIERAIDEKRFGVGSCQVCGTEFTFKSNYERNIRPRQFCSKSCATKSKGSGENHPNWRGGRVIDSHGYVLLNVKDGVTKTGWRPEHHLVMEKMLGRKLKSPENVHHKNGNRQDNRPENLELWAKMQPKGQRVAEQGHCPTCTCGKI